MYKHKSIGVVVPAFNEERQIGKVLATMPDYVDKIVVVNDASIDKTTQIIKKKIKNNKKIILVQHKKNQGVGGAIASGYKWCRDNSVDIAVVMAGDGQMLAEDLPKILDPVAEDKADYSKANRLLSGKAYKTTPKSRYLGNAILSFFTKIASGYWHIMDSQSGYTAINKKMLYLLDWNSMYKRYGQPNDLLIRLNIFNARVKDVQLDPVYGIGEKSGLKISNVFLQIPFMLLRMFLWRLKEKYIIRDFHPLVFFYFFGFLSGFISILLAVRWIYLGVVKGDVPKITFLAWMLCVIAAIQFISFAMWFDMEYNKKLR